MPPTLPISLSPHVCILPSQDLVELLEEASLPALHQVLQAFSPLSRIETRTTSLVPVTHQSFSLRFSDLLTVELACKEDEEQRAARTLDWIGSRIQRRCVQWAEDMEKIAEKEFPRTPWWDELKRCVEGDRVPSRTEGWNHPVAIILAVSTNTPNPLAAIDALHSRQIDLPSWVDSTCLWYTLIIHPQNSALTDEEAQALFNAVKKQYKLHSYLLQLALPDPSPDPVPIPIPLPQLPPPSLTMSPAMNASPRQKSNDLALDGPNSIRMNEADIKNTAQFVREFLLMSLLPWMERQVVEWNENFSSTRRLPSRLFSSTRRLFGSQSPSPSPSPTPTHGHSTSVSSAIGRSQSMNIDGRPLPAPPSQQRRLAEFATILGDLKLAITVWEALRKESKGGSDILPFLLSPTPASVLHVSNVLNALHAQSFEARPNAQVQAIRLAARWENGIPLADFIGNVLEGEKWLVWAASIAEELPSALLVGHAALLSSNKKARRRAAFWYTTAASRLEKCGIKPLTLYFLRRAHGICRNRAPRELSPLFWESENKSEGEEEGFDAILPGIEHPLGRLLYTTGDVSTAVRYFVGLLKESPPPLFPHALFPTEPVQPTTNTKVFLDDFRVAFGHYKSVAGDQFKISNLRLPISFCQPQKTTLQLGVEEHERSAEEWKKREADWRSFWKARRGTENLVPPGKASVGEVFWVNLAIRNPLDVDVSLSNLTLRVRDTKSDDDTFPDFVDIESLDDVVLAARESRTVSLSIKASKSVLFIITHATYDFLGLLPCVESLASQGPRLHGTQQQRVTPTYAPDVFLKADVVDKTHKLSITFAEEERLSMVEGEVKRMVLHIVNEGLGNISEFWLVGGREDEIWVGDNEELSTHGTTETLTSEYTLAQQQPSRIILHNEQGETLLRPGDIFCLPLTLHASRPGERDLNLFFVYSEDEKGQFHISKVARRYEVRQLLQVSAAGAPTMDAERLFSIALEVFNSSQVPVRLKQISILSPSWRCIPDFSDGMSLTLPLQTTRLQFSAFPWSEGSGIERTRDFVSRQLNDILHGRPIDILSPPPMDLICTHTHKPFITQSICRQPTRHFIGSGRRNYVVRSLRESIPHIPSTSFPHIFPLYNPSSVDILVFWDIPPQQRSGHLYIAGLNIGAGHAALSRIIDGVRNAKVGRSMYAETQREKNELLGSVQNSEWNAEMNPLTLLIQVPDRVVHDFAKGPTTTKIPFVLRNHSLTHHSRYILRLNSTTTSTPDFLSAAYAGRTSFRGSLPPEGSLSISVPVWISRAGTYNLGGWQFETQVLEPSEGGGEAEIRHRYTQSPSASDRVTFIVCDKSA